MIQNIGQNPQIQRNKPSFRADSPTSNPISNTNPKALSNSLEIMGANNLASINIQTDQNELLKLEKEVFEPLKDFKGTNEEFTKKAYSLIIKHKGLEDVAPALKIISLEDKAGYFDYMNHELSVSATDINEFGHGDILALLSHEIDHLEKYGDIACILGVDEFTEGGAAILLSTKADMKEKETREGHIEENTQEMQEMAKKFQAMNKENIIKKINKEWKDSEGEDILKVLFPNSIETSSKEEIISKFKNIKSEELTEAYNSFMDRIVFDYFSAQKKFWTNFVAKKGRKTPEQLDYDIKPLIEDFKTTKNTEAMEKTKGFYNYLKIDTTYHSKPFEQSAFESEAKTIKKWNDFLIKNGITPHENRIKDARPTLALFDKIDKHLTEKFPEAQRSEEFGNLMSDAYDKLKKQGIKEKDIANVDVFNAILEELEP